PRRRRPCGTCAAASGQRRVKALFEVVAGPLAWPRTPGVCFAGLRTVAFDGLNSLKVPDTDRNRSWIGRIRFRMGFAGYPTLRLMALAEAGTRGLLGAVLGSAAAPGHAPPARPGLRREHLPRRGPCHRGDAAGPRPLRPQPPRPAASA